MNYATIKNLVSRAQQDGSARYEAWQLTLSGNILIIYHNGGKIARFYMTAYEDGYLETIGVPSKLECRELEHIEHYLLGLAPRSSF